MGHRPSWRRAMFAAVTAAVTAALAGAPAFANDWRVVADGSQILFDYQRNGRAAVGSFSRMEGSGDFDAAAPGEARFRLSIDIRSIDLGDPLESLFAQTEDWFDAANYPLATYELTGLRRISDSDYEATGLLTIKGVTRPLRTTMTLRVGAWAAEAQGLVAFARRDFAVGVGLSDRLIDIGPSIAIRFHFAATRS